jgi:hypothetical protein
VNIVIGVRMNAGERKMDSTREREKECRKGRNLKRMYECMCHSVRERRKEMQRRICVCERE